MDFRQTVVIGTSWDKGELIRFWGQKVKGRGHNHGEGVQHSMFL